MYIPFNSRKSYHKSKFGAIKENDTVRFRVVLPRKMCCTGVSLIIRRDDESRFDAYRCPFSWERMEGENEEWWYLDYKPETAGLYMYFFECYTVWGANVITRFDGGNGLLLPDGTEFQLTVCAESFKTPDWLKGGIIYQIFPDRFNFSGNMKKMPADRHFRSDWGGEPEWRPTPDGKVLNKDFFGGDLKGIEEKLGYIASLGVSCIYLNPIFEANSNHRYDTADYTKIDSALGSENDFKALCLKAERYGISVILDGVFSHTGDDSIYFNKYNRYASLGAYQSKESEYYEWYSFQQFPDRYSSWWGIDILPEVNETNDKFIEFITGENGVARKWLRCGARGWRLDVADELPDKFIDAFRKAVKAEKSDALLLGEVWEDASNKISYGGRRRYLQGDQLDSVMNYPFADAILEFVRNGEAETFFEKIMTVLENYPKDVVDVLMNHIGTHDTMRAITALAGENCEYRDRQWQSERSLSREEYAYGIRLMKIASLIQFTLPGVPSVYYGDEAGMQGYKDPFNRVCFPWGSENAELMGWYKKLGSFRRSHTVFEKGDFVELSGEKGVIAYKRIDSENEITVIVNRNKEPITYYLDESTLGGRLYFSGIKKDGGIYMEGNSALAIVKGE